MWILLAIASIIVITLVVGTFMPVRYWGETVVEFDAGVQQVWDALQDANAHPMTGRMMKSVESLPAVDGMPTWTEGMRRGEIITVKTTVFETPRRMIREMSQDGVNMSSTWEYTLEPTQKGCKVTLSGVTDIEKGTWHTPVFRVMMQLGGGVKKGLDIQLGMVSKSLNKNV